MNDEVIIRNNPDGSITIITEFHPENLLIPGIIVEPSKIIFVDEDESQRDTYSTIMEELYE